MQIYKTMRKWPTDFKTVTKGEAGNFWREEE